MKTLALVLTVSALLAQDAKPAASDIAGALESANGKSVIIIEPKARATDLAQAFDFLRKDKPSQKIMVRITANTTYTSVTDVTPSTGGTLLMIKTLSNQGVRTHFVPVEQVMEIGYSP